VVTVSLSDEYTLIHSEDKRIRLRVLECIGQILGATVQYRVRNIFAAESCTGNQYPQHQIIVSILTKLGDSCANMIRINSRDFR